MTDLPHRSNGLIFGGKIEGNNCWCLGSVEEKLEFRLQTFDKCERFGYLFREKVFSVKVKSAEVQKYADTW